MGSKQKLQDTLSADLLPGETVAHSRPLVANGRIERGEHSSHSALLGPTVFACRAVGAIAEGSVPDGTNFVVMTDRRLLWCHKGHLSGDLDVRGSDFLSTLAHAMVIPARVALAKLHIELHGGDTVRFDLPSDHKADKFVRAINDHIAANPTFAPPADVAPAA